MICWRLGAKLSYQFKFGSVTAKGAYGNSPKGGVFPGTSSSTFESNWWIVVGRVPGVGARCGNGLFSTYKSPKFYLSFTILVSFILVRYPDRIGLPSSEYGTVPTVPTVGTVGTSTAVRYCDRAAWERKGTRKMLARTDKET